MRYIKTEIRIERTPDRAEPVLNARVAIIDTENPLDLSYDKMCSGELPAGNTQKALDNKIKQKARTLDNLMTMLSEANGLL